MKKIKIYIDFDGTLFDADAFYKDFLMICKENGISFENIKSYEKEIFNEDNLFNLKKLLYYMMEKLPLNDLFFDKVISMFSDKYIYDDVLEPLIKLNNSYELILLTFGDYEYQNDKIKATGLDKYFSKIIFTQKNKSQLDEVDYKNGIFIDNNPKELIRFFKRCGKKVIRIRRNTDKYSKGETNIKEIAEYKNFTKLVDDEFSKKIV